MSTAFIPRFPLPRRSQSSQDIVSRYAPGTILEAQYLSIRTKISVIPSQLSQELSFSKSSPRNVPSIRTKIPAIPSSLAKDPKIPPLFPSPIILRAMSPAYVPRFPLLTLVSRSLTPQDIAFVSISYATYSQCPQHTYQDYRSVRLSQRFSRYRLSTRGLYYYRCISPFATVHKTSPPFLSFDTPLAMSPACVPRFPLPLCLQKLSRYRLWLLLRGL
ncbi:hypothetical protein BC629DRAFT_185392 [Irpex lacteus]|nr:hypothetical protein BC629DRAFT_185392 [Irpex lacteus]